MCTQSLYDHFRKHSRSYYKIRINLDELFNPIRGTCRCSTFIDRHLADGHKLKVREIPDGFRDIYNKKGKHQHGVCLYLLGLTLKSCFEKPIETDLSGLIEEMGWFDFSYTWFLTSLYHDIASSIERKSDHDTLLNDVTNSQLFVHQPMQRSASLLRFDKDLILNYLKYRRRAGSLEHGIVGGTLIFDKLSDSFRKHTEKHDWGKNPVCEKDGLTWRREHLDHFAYIADAICCHNLWTVKEADKSRCDEYSANGLDKLIVRGDADRLSIREYPLQFMLCLLDTIEPIKKFSNLDAKTVLNNVYLELLSTSGNPALRLEWTKELKGQPQIYDWLKSITTLPDWMQVEVTPCECSGDRCSVTISIL